MNSTINAMLKLSGKILADGTYAKSVLNGQITSVCGIDSLQMGVFAGVIVGLVTAALHNRFYKQQLPAALAFFSGVRFVPIISVIAHIGVGIICFFVWPTIQSGIFALGNLVMHSGYFGTAIFFHGGGTSWSSLCNVSLCKTRKKKNCWRIIILSSINIIPYRNYRTD